MESALRAKSLDVLVQYERQLKELQEAYREPCWNCTPEKIGVPAGQGRQVIEAIRPELIQDGFDVVVSKICLWFGIAMRSAYYKHEKTERDHWPRAQFGMEDALAGDVEIVNVDQREAHGEGGWVLTASFWSRSQQRRGLRSLRHR